MKGTMRAARGYPGEDQLRLEEVPIPEIGPNDALVKVAATGLAPGPVLWWKHGVTQPLPVTPGHEIAGTVVEVGELVGDFKAGARVRVHANLTCRDCLLCRTDRESFCAEASIIGGVTFGPEGAARNAPYHDGGLAEYVKVPAANLDPVPDHLPLEIAARCHELGVAARALKLAAVEPGGALIILAATGAMGVATIRQAPLYGIGRVIAVGRSRERLERVKALDPGLVEVVALEELPEDWAEKGALIGAIRRFAPQGASAITDYLADGKVLGQVCLAMRNSGTAVIVGSGQAPLALPTAVLMVRGIRVIGSRSCIRRDATELIGLAASGRVQVADLVSHRLPLANVNEAVGELLTRSQGAWLITIMGNEGATAAATGGAPEAVAV